jgi:urease accessory protein UreE
MKLFHTASLSVIDALPDVAAEDLRRKQADELVLTWEERRWLRGRFTTRQGRRVAIALPTGTQLESGRLLWVAEDWYLTLEAATEALLAVHVADRQQAIVTAFEIGNLHFPLAVEGEYLLVPEDTAMVQLLGRLGLDWERRQGPFQPAGKGQPHGF